MGAGRSRVLVGIAVVAVVIGAIVILVSRRHTSTDGADEASPGTVRTVSTVPIVTGTGPGSDHGDSGADGPMTTAPKATVTGTAAPVTTLHLRNRSGDEAIVVVTRGKLGRHAQGEEHGAVLGAECDFDEDRDAAMPLDITIEAASPPPPYSLGVDMELQTPSDFEQASPSLTVDTEALHSPDTRVCIFRREDRPVFAVVRGAGVTQGSTHGWVIVHDYLVGDRAANRKKLTDAGWWLRPAGGSPDAYKVVEVDGAATVAFPIVNTKMSALPFAPGFDLGCAVSADC